MKRFLALLLAAVMLISFTACKSEDGEKGKNTDKADKTPVFSENAVKDNTYENKSTGISCTLGTGWTFCSGEELRTLNGVSSSMSEKDFADYLGKIKHVTEMYAEHVNGTDTVSLTYERLGKDGAAEYDVSKVYESSRTIFESSYATLGYKDVKSEIVDVTVDGTETKALRMSSVESTYGANVYLLLVCGEKDGYAWQISITTFKEDTTKNVLEGFKFEK